MKSDLTRETFDRALHYSAVRLQQGRIVTDADWNEQADLTRYRAERQAGDIIGRCGAPMDAAGYALVAETNALAVHAVNPTTAWIIGEDGALLTTTDSGASWTLVDLQTTARLYALHRAGNVGWLVGEGGVVCKTSDGGGTWTSQEAGTLQTLRGVAVWDDNHAWAVGDAGIVVLTTDGGQHWSLVQTDTARLYAVRFRDASGGLAVGRSGAIISTRDGGQTWTRADSGTGAHLYGMAISGTNLAWAAGQNGTILRSTDFGATWRVSATSSTATLHAIGFVDANEGWAAGVDGVVLHSTDGGVSWTLQDVGTTAALRGVSVLAGQPGWLVGDGSVVRRLTLPAAAVALPPVNLSITPGRCYVNGILCELEARGSYAHQPDGGTTERLPPGSYLMYLDVWQHHLSALEAPAIREVALGGPDTATRAQTICQVKALPLPATSPSDWNCDSVLPEWDELISAPRPRLSARGEPQLAASNLCEIAATAGYRRLENQLYRVEVHGGGANPTFKWSRENGSVAYAVVSVTINSAAQRTTVRIAARGRDANLDLAVHDRVELIDEDAELTQHAGTLFEYIADGEDELELILAGVSAGALGQDVSRHPVLRRWDHKPAVSGTNVLPIVEGTWIDLEDGVQVRFEAGGLYRPGDYWLIPARTITADVEWPRDDQGDPVAREPTGIVDSYCRLAIVEVDVDGAVRVTSDCREFFPPLTELQQLLYVSGDGQDAAPDTLLPQPLALRVSRGMVPVPGAGVRFEVESGNGLVGDGLTGSPWYETTTDDMGYANCRWTLGPGMASPARYQRVRARLLDADGHPLPGQTIVYCATATLVLQYVSGDGQQATAGATLPNPLEFRVVNGGDGVPGVVLTATVQGGGAVIGPQPTDQNGYASVGWRLGPGGAQRLTVRLTGSDGKELQRLTYTANFALGGGCEITIGTGGQFKQLDNELLKQLLTTGEGTLCLCFLPGKHDISGLNAKGDGKGRLSLHGCGPTALLNMTMYGVNVAGFATVELRDLSIDVMQKGNVKLVKNGEVRLVGLDITLPADSEEPGVEIALTENVRITGCRVNVGGKAPAAILDQVTGDCYVTQNRFDGTVSFYGAPGNIPAEQLISKLQNGGFSLGTNNSQLHFLDNNLQLLTIGNAVASSLLNMLKVDGLFQTTVLQGNTFGAKRNMFAAGLLSFDSNSLLAPDDAQHLPYGAMIANQAAAAGNVAVVSNDNTLVHFLTPTKYSFRGAANIVYTWPSST